MPEKFNPKKILSFEGLDESTLSCKEEDWVSFPVCKEVCAAFVHGRASMETVNAEVKPCFSALWKGQSWFVFPILI